MNTCIHLGRVLRTEHDTASDIRVARNVYDCKQFGECTVTEPLHGRPACNRCSAHCTHSLSEQLGAAGRVDVSIITTCKGRLRHLRQSLPTWRKATKYRVEIIVVDYDDPDESFDFARRQQVTAVAAAGKHGASFCLAHARNCGARTARGTLLAFVDADMCLNDGWIDAAADSLIKRQAVLTKVHYRPGTPWDLCGTCMVTADAFHRVRGYDEQIVGWGREDGDFYGRIQRCGRATNFADSLLQPIGHSDSERSQYYPDAKSASSGRIERYLARRRGEVNPGSYGRGVRRIARTDGTPMVYALLCTARSGSSWLSELLPGEPSEHWNAHGHTQTHTLDGAALINAIAVNGLAGIKVNVSALNQWQARLELLRPERVIRLRRRDRVAQAISLYRANASGVWSRQSGDVTPGPPSYDDARIAACLADLDRDERAIDAWLAGQNHVEVWYEDVVSDRAGELARICEYLGTPVPPASATLQIQRDQISEEYGRRFRASTAERATSFQAPQVLITTP